MIAHWMLYCLVIGLLLSLAALAMEQGMRAFGRPQRWVWAAAAVLTLAIPAATRWLPRAAPAAPAATWAPTSASEKTLRLAEPTAAVAEREPWMDVAALDRPLAIGWMALTGAALLVLIAAWAVLERRRRDWRAAEVDGVPVLLSPATGPAVFGLFRGRIVLPRWVVEDAPSDARALLLEHEQEHLRAGDPRLLALGLASVALMPWNPAAWWQLRRLRLAVEMDCDARVLRRRADVRAYGALLLEVGRRGTGGRLLAVAFSEPRSFLERRIRMMTERMHPPRARSLVPVLAVCAGALLGMRALPAPAAPVQRSVASADTARPVLVNGAAVTRALQREYPPLLRDAGVRGSAEIQLRVSEQGIPAELRAVQASHPAFAEAAVRALSAARFRPARVGEQYVAYTLTLPVRFDLDGEDEWPPIAAGAVPPGEGAWDQPPVPLNVDEIARALAAEYPPLLRDAGITARAQVRVRIAATGEVAGVETLSTTHPEAGPAAERALARARFRPARKDGRPVATEMVMPVEFRVPAAGES